MSIFTRIIVFLLLLACLAPTMAAADNHAGVRAGFNVANMTFAGRGSYDDFRIGAAGGVFARFEKSERVAYQFEVLFMQAGDKGGINQETQTLKLDYIQVPAMFRFDFAKSNKYEPYFVCGPALGLLIGAVETSEISGLDEQAGLGGDDAEASLDGTSELDVRSDFFTVDLGLVVGVGGVITTVLEDNAVGVDVRYNLGILDIDEYTSDSVSARTSTFTVSAFFTFF